LQFSDDLVGEALEEPMKTQATTIRPFGSTPETAPRYDVLVVEDDGDIRDQLAVRLRDEGFSVATASDGREAMKLLDESPVSAVIIDLMLPVMNGWQLVDAIRAHPERQNLPILVITAVSNVDRAPVGPVFLKPLNVESLVRAVRFHVRGAVA
jgi:DNA-binding response OmpR family regulator